MPHMEQVTTSRFLRALRDDVDDDQRAALVAGMAEALSAKPYPRVTVEDVVVRARLPRTAFFQHFADKEECFLATYETCGELLRAQTAAAVLGSAGEPYSDRIAHGVRAYLDTLASEPGLARAFLRDVSDAGPEALRRRRAVNERFATMIRLLAEQHRDELPEGYAVHPEMARELVEALEALVLGTIADDRPQDLPRLTDTATRMIHAALVAGD
ncbi:MAG: Transcriptional regulator, TetR family [Conexibacter sp.]|nr:Transcriptional regulator, TetR family [Conexibacter sp.]